ncbi:hypothetical protein AAZX31_19G035500 [Glycine max]|uniref:Anthocyanin acyltransferase n=2 Tax=Glycine subgen. Soja TaxID=1462606 RepID=A0A0R0ESF4_SOYBN|nr:coumaroyl-CoA:anthocyanidin 3-O-glucoside-6''-O-coumaroyltransferase 1 [Glycine max]XP_028217729.1 coumaroyl-CoA:anthocyanidin 3-O-glucoside-6''-O-coumaroyltransferase 1-like [Glycine soja]KAG4911828.1 hypothetical protein JHK86_052261 [Glycine max]KAG4926630.1 hypothetical protein JHK85_053116 [Glycine max]KAG5082263.1 hypothetical protein JHK84_052301 [Glycine max]KAG5085025.1 hypothetical protein JHK82_052422 [Glycine max]KAH1076311.1 hypothetical protein GYH30_051979 [Glycine max]|eukprot:XP_006603948.1 coumaroyl-CoA:anthocyanidin 3-O-glucoside-6''-O-coumaroyltransferase 1 [Glycine max]
MAHPADLCQKLKVIEQCQVSPPPGSVPPTSLPLTFLDLPWVYCNTVQSIFFFEFPHSCNHFLQTVLPNLKHSLSLTLQQFFPFVGNFVIPPKPNFPHILYTSENSISFTIAESTAEFPHLIADTARDVKDSHPFVPILPTPTTKEDGTWLLPLMAIQLTIFPEYGFSICISFRHVVADARAFLHFMKFWSYVCRTKHDVAATQDLLPLLNRDIIKDPKGLKFVFLEELWNSPIESIIKTPPKVVDKNDDKVRHAFVLRRDHVAKLKKWVSIECKSTYGLELESLHISTFVVTSALMWVCKVQSEEEANAITIANNNNNDEIYSFTFLGDCRNRPEFSIPSTYFGNCVVFRMVSLNRSKLMGEKGIVEAAISIGRKVRDFQFDAMKDFENFMSLCRGGKKLNHASTIAGSPKLGTYETDFGWGKPKKCEILHIEYSRTISLSDCRDEEGGVEVELALGRAQMSKFSAILEEYLRNIAI